MFSSISQINCLIAVINKGQVMSEYYRLMNRKGGYTWVQTCATVILNSKNSEEQSIICINYVLRYDNNFHYVNGYRATHVVI